LKFFGIEQPPVINYTIDQMAELAKHVVERSVTVPGVQPKLSMTLVKETKTQSNPRLTVVGALGGGYIFKPPVDSYPEMPANEHVTMRMAEIFGIRTVQSSLIRLASGELSYITKRVDRSPEGEKTHMIDMFQVLEAFDKYIGSYEKIGKAIGRYSENPQLDKLFFFEMVLFSFLTCNSDMHLKNFSMIQSKSGWILSPAYDLLNVSIILPEDEEDLALTITGKKKKLNRDHFRVFAEGMQLTKKQINGVFSRFQDYKSQAEDLISESFLSERMRKQYLATVENRFGRII
jgi:serine/threonine-protein kinase HipA